MREDSVKYKIVGIVLFSVLVFLLSMAWPVHGQVDFGDCQNPLRTFGRVYFTNDTCGQAGSYFTFVLLNKDSFDGSILTGNDFETCYIRPGDRHNRCTIFNPDGVNNVNSVTPFGHTKNAVIKAFYTSRPLDNPVFIPAFFGQDRQP